ncbi:mitochondria-eating protein isoform X1 [Elephas maximus indicus]|uniref:mitochondria-eating protein isoform X1 n=1 Tax=Elephas maximus indicus TaxID=99487 RepID=UPI002115E36A|nr:mitochondria-eating protein isoform X1 [Elephas maximus indicus]
MAENLRKIVSNEFLRSLPEKLDSWLREYNANSCDQNLNICLELIEQVAKLQGQLFGILSTAAQEGGHYAGVEIIKSRLLPWLEASFTAASMGKPVDSTVPSLQDTFDKERNSLFRDQDLQLDSELGSIRNQPKQVQDDLTETEKTLEETKNRSAISLLAAEEEINQLRKHLKSLQSQEESRHRNSDYYSDYRGGERGRSIDHRSVDLRSVDLRSVDLRSVDLRGAELRGSEPRGSEPRGSEPRGSEPRGSEPRGSEPWGLELRGSEPRGSEPRSMDLKNLDRRSTDQRNPEVISDYEKQLRTLKDEIAVLSAEKNVLQGRSLRSRSPSPAPRSRPASRAASRSASPSTAVAKIRTPSPNRSKLSSVARKAALLSRFSDAYSQARLDAQCLLRRCIDKAEMVQRIVYIATVEAFHVAKMAFRHFKIRVRKTLTPSHSGSNNFEDVVSDYIICHLDLYDAQSSVNDVIRAMNVNPKISFPPEVDFCLLSDFIQEICCIAFAMQTLDPPLDIAFGADGEIFNDCKYRRSYDSDFTAPLVFYHVWPALMENDCVIMKGEAVTKRGAFWNSVRPVTRCRSRSLSPVYPRSRICLSTLSRSRSPSPIRCGLPRF